MEINAINIKLDELKTQPAGMNPEIVAQFTNVQTAIAKIQKGTGTTPGSITGLEAASTGLASALKVVESSDRAIPSQAVEVYQQSDAVAKAETAEWTKLKSTYLAQLNEALRQAGVAPLQHLRNRARCGEHRVAIVPAVQCRWMGVPLTCWSWMFSPGRRRLGGALDVTSCVELLESESAEVPLRAPD